MLAALPPVPARSNGLLAHTTDGKGEIQTVAVDIEGKNHRGQVDPLGIRERFPIRASVRLGATTCGVGSFCQALSRDPFDISIGANRLLSHPGFQVTRHALSLDLAMPTPRELGFGSPVCCERIIVKAFDHGLLPCPHDLGPETVLQCKALPNCVCMGMWPLYTKEGGFIFCVRSVTVETASRIKVLRELCCGNANPDSLWPLDQPFAFALPHLPT